MTRTSFFFFLGSPKGVVSDIPGDCSRFRHFYEPVVVFSPPRWLIEESSQSPCLGFVSAGLRFISFTAVISGTPLPISEGLTFFLFLTRTRRPRGLLIFGGMEMYTLSFLTRRFLIFPLHDYSTMSFHWRLGNFRVGATPPPQLPIALPSFPFLEMSFFLRNRSSPKQN